MNPAEPARVLFSDLLPGETPIDDASELKVEGITTRRELAVAEARNIMRAVLKYFRDRPTRELAGFDLDWAHRLHAEMFGDVWGWAGRPRLKNLNLGVPFHQIDEALYNLLEDLKTWEESGMDLVEQAARLHHRAVSIHPYPNGNGRWARMLANLWLGTHGSQAIEWPEDTIGAVSPIRGEYIAALGEADAGDIAHFVEMHRRYLGKDEA